MSLRTIGFNLVCSKVDGTKNNLVLYSTHMEWYIKKGGKLT